MAIEYDALLEKVGGFGTYQRKLLAILFFPVIFDAMLALSPNFIIAEHKHRCRIPGESDFYGRNISHLSVYNVSQCTIDVNGSSVECTEWVYDQSLLTDSIISSFNIVCKEKEWREHLILAVFLGVFLGNIGNNLMSDIYGRKITICVDLILIVIGMVPRPWVNSIYALLVLRFIVGVGGQGFYQISFILGTEQVSPQYRVGVNFAEHLCFTTGQFVLVFVAYFVRDWHYLTMACGFPFILTIFHWFLISESPRWLLAKGRTKNAINILEKAAKMNNVNIDIQSEEIFLKKEEMEPFLKTVKSLFTSRVLVKRLIILAVCFFAVNLTYYGISLNIGILGGDIYINFLISAVMELIGVTIPFLILNKLGRKGLHVVSLVVAGSACFCTIFSSLYASNDLKWITVALAMIGKLAITINFFVVYTYTAELFPTLLRSVAMGICSTTGRLGTISSAYIGALGKNFDTKFGRALPLIIFGCFGLAAGLMSIMLPETTSKPLPETIVAAAGLERKDKPGDEDNFNDNEKSLIKSESVEMVET